MSRKAPIQIEVNPNILEMEYAVRGPIPQRAAELAADGRVTIPCNIGNPQALGQAPITWYRQVLSLVEDPSRIERERKLLNWQQAHSDAKDISVYPVDVIDRAADFLQQSKGLGAYTESNGPRFIRESVARFIDDRDREGAGDQFVPANPDQIYITNGASEGVKYLLDMLITGPQDGIMIPIPQYPLYSATIRKAGGTQVNYFPNEEQGWLINREILNEALQHARQKGITVKAIVVINPGNPTGAILDEATIDDIIRFAAEHDLVILADEVYQENVYGGEFFSFARVLGKRPVPLFSLHSISKGYYGECGHRGGYLEVRNPPVAAANGQSFISVLQKQASVSLCSNTVGQLMVWMMVSPPAPDQLSYPLFQQERSYILGELEAKATLIREAFTQMDGVEIFGRTGAMYLFPRLNQLPAGTGDYEYCMALLEETGLTTVNGSGFGQREGTHHLRIAFLPPREMLADVLPAWVRFHNRYVNRPRQ